MDNKQQEVSRTPKTIPTPQRMDNLNSSTKVVNSNDITKLFDGIPDMEFDFSLFEKPSENNTNELPIWVLPTKLQNVINSVTNGYQCSRDYAVASMMVASATILGKRVTSKFNNYVNYPSLWIAIVGNTASGKTAPLSFFFKPIEKIERNLYNDYRSKYEEWEMNDKKGTKPLYKHMLVNNPSDESVLHELSINGSICWKTDELRTMIEGFGKYCKNGGTIVGNLLSIFNNIDIQITRVTSEPKHISVPNLNIIGGIQPSILHRVMAGKDFTEDGLFQRFLFVYPEQKDIPLYEEYSISVEIRNEWEMTIEDLSHIENLTIGETADALKLHIGAINQWRSECNENYNKIDAMISLLKKLEIHLCRWSMVVAVLSGKNIIDADVMRYSIECMQYFKSCGEKAFCLIANEPRPKEPSKSEVFKQLQKWYPNLNQSRMADALGISQQAVNKLLK